MDEIIWKSHYLSQVQWFEVVEFAIFWFGIVKASRSHGLAYVLVNKFEPCAKWTRSSISVEKGRKFCPIIPEFWLEIHLYWNIIVYYCISSILETCWCISFHISYPLVSDMCPSKHYIWYKSILDHIITSITNCSAGKYKLK